MNGFPQGPNGLIVPNGSIRLQLNTDATIIAAPYGFVFAANPVTFQFNSAGQIQPNTGAFAQIFSNRELNPQNSFGLGTYYLVTFYDQNGALLNTTPLWWQFPETIGTTVDISNMTALATIGGNIIFYPTNFLGGTGTVTSVAFVGDGTILSTTPSTPVTTSGNIVATLLTQSAGLVLAGPTSGPAAAPTFRALVAADLPPGLITGTLAATQIAVGTGVNTLGGYTEFTYNHSTGIAQIGSLIRFDPNLSLGVQALSMGYFRPTGNLSVILTNANYAGAGPSGYVYGYDSGVGLTGPAGGSVTTLAAFHGYTDGAISNGATCTNLVGADIHVNTGVGFQTRGIGVNITFEGNADYPLCVGVYVQPMTPFGGATCWGIYSANTGGYFGADSTVVGNALVQRLKNNQGTVYSGADSAIVLGAGWGNSAAVSAAIGYDQSLQFTITCNGTGIAADPTLTITFKDGTWTNAPIAMAVQNGGTGAMGLMTCAPTATTDVVIWNGTPSAGLTYVITVAHWGI